MNDLSAGSERLLALDFLSGGGEMGGRIRALDWSRTPLGPAPAWPQSLRSPLSMMLPSKAQIILFWGPAYVVFYNDAYRSVFGAKHPRMLGEPGRLAWSEIWDSGVRLHDLLDGVVATGEAFKANDMLFLLERFGFVEETYFDVSYDPVRGETGQVAGVYCIVTETTARVIGERRLAFLSDLATSTSPARNPSEACSLAMRAVERHPGKAPFAQVWLGDALQASTAGAEAAIRDAPRDGICELDLVIAGSPLRGRLVVGLNPRRPFDEPYREFLGLVANQLATAIATGHAYAQERGRAEALAQIDRAKTSFFTNLSHEFRTPLTLMLGPLEDLDARLPTTADRVLVATAHRNAERLLRLVNSLLDYARIEGGRAVASFEPVDFVAVNEALASTFRSACERAGLALHICAQPLPQPVHVDREQWEKIVLNLLSNAFKFTWQGGIEVHVRPAADGTMAELEVRDTGAGIPATQLDRVFDRFHRVEGVRGRSIEGSGIGLALVLELVKLHGGSIAVASEVGRGTAFTVRLPFGHAHLPPAQVRLTEPEPRALAPTQAEAFVGEALGWLPPDSGAPAAEQDAPGPALAGPRSGRVLVADDNADLRAYLGQLLGDRWRVAFAADGQQALEQALADPPDLVLCDVMMPGLDGLALLARLRGDERTRTCPVILLSARAGDEAREEGLAAGADDYITKPFSARELRARVAAQLATARLRRDVEGALREREAKYRSLFDSIDEGFCIVEVLFDAAGVATDYRFLETNAVFERQSGLEHAAGCTALELVPGLEREWIDLYGRVASTGQAVRVERESAPMGRWFDVFASRVGGPGSRLVAIVFRDVTARKRLEARSVLLDRIGSDLTQLGSPDEIMQAVGARVSRTLRLSSCIFVDVEETEDRVTVHHGWIDAAVPDLKQTFRLRDYVDDEFIRVSRAGEPFVVVDTATDPRTDAQAYRRLRIGALVTVPFLWRGRWTAYLAATSVAPRPWQPDEVELLREVAMRLFSRIERARAEEALARSRALLARELKDTRQLQRLSARLIEDGNDQDLHEHILDVALAVMGAEFGSIQTFDPEKAELRLSAWRRFPAQARELWAVVSAEHQTSCGKALQTGQRVFVSDVHDADAPIEPESRRMYASLGIVAMQSTPLMARDGRLLGMLSTHWSEVHVPGERELRLLDILVRQAADFLERSRARHELREADRRKDEFLATLAHELRNPLAPIRNSLHILRLAGISGDEQKPVLDRVERQLDHVVRLVDDLMEVSRITRGRIQLQREILDLADVLRHAAEIVAGKIRAAHNTLSLELPDGPQLVHGDSVRLTQVFANLLDNAAKYSDPGGRITVALRRDDGAAVISVRDTGTGIPEEMLPRVFDLFAQVDRTLGRAQGGLGIGLALVKSLVLLHEGKVEARSEGPGRGSEFIVRLPLLAAAPADSPAAAATPPAAALAGQRILVVDDNRDAADSLAALLELLGAQVRTAYDGPSALEAARLTRPEVVLLDLGMPGMDGYAVAMRLRSEPPSQPLRVIALTGWGQESDQVRTRSAGFDEHLVKPVAPDALIALLAPR